jgi:hypothetical protein
MFPFLTLMVDSTGKQTNSVLGYDVFFFFVATGLRGKIELADDNIQHRTVVYGNET